MKSVTRWFVLLRFDSCKPTPRWGGHKDRVSFNPFPLSNGHLDRVSFSPQSIGTLSPHKDHHNLVSLALITKVLRTRMGKRKSDPKARTQMNTNISLSLVTNCLEWSLDLGEDLISCLCLGVKSRAFVLNAMAEKLGCLEVWWLGGIYSSNHQSGRWGWLLSTGAPDSPVRHGTLSGAPATSPNR
jgi:hypothetical protein